MVAGSIASPSSARTTLTGVAQWSSHGNAIGKVELALLTAVSAAYGYALGKHALAGALGRAASAALDAQVQQTMAAMVRSHIRAELGIEIELPSNSAKGPRVAGTRGKEDEEDR